MMRTCRLYRIKDTTGISGTGPVAHIAVFPDGTCAMRWNTTLSSTAIYNTIGELIQIHGHNNDTVLQEWDGQTWWTLADEGLRQADPGHQEHPDPFNMTLIEENFDDMQRKINSLIPDGCTEHCSFHQGVCQCGHIVLVPATEEIGGEA